MNHGMLRAGRRVTTAGGFCLMAVAGQLMTAYAGLAQSTRGRRQPPDATTHGPAKRNCLGSERVSAVNCG